MLWCDEEICEKHRGSGSIDRIVRCVLRNIHSADLSIVIFTRTDVPEVREVVKTMGNGLVFRYAMSTKLLVESEVIGYLPNMQRAWKRIVTRFVPDEVVGGG